jgi:hypothetical protein
MTITPDEMLRAYYIDPAETGPCVTKLREVFAEKCKNGLTGVHASYTGVPGPSEERAYECLQWEWAIKRGHTYPWVENPRWWHFVHWIRCGLARFLSWKDRNTKPFGVERP